MAELKRRTLTLSSGKQIKLYGNSLAIGKSLQIGEGGAPNIFSFLEQQQEEKSIAENPKDLQEGKPVKVQPAKKTTVRVLNPYNLTEADFAELADFNIRLWMDFKDSIRKHGVNDPKIFNRDALL